MPISYYGSRISPHITRTPEGYLVCHSVPINRVGAYKYLGTDIGIDGQDAAKEFQVLRRPEEVFSKSALASFEGKPVTDNHPPGVVTPDNIQIFQKGHVQNVREGKDGYTLADLYITDPDLIHEIEDKDHGKREVSCGYNFTLFKHPNGTLEQRNMVGNHVAIVDEGRAGPTVRINDSAKNERSNHMSKETKGGIFGRMLKVFAADASPEELEEAIKLHKDEGEEEPAAMVPDKDDEENAHDEDAGAQLNATLMELCKMCKSILQYVQPKTEGEDDDDLSELASHKEPDGDEEGPDIDNDGDGRPEGASDNEEDVVTDPEDIEEKKDVQDSMQKVALGVRDILRKSIKDPKAYKVAAKDAASEIRKAFNIGPADDSGYGKIAKITAAAAKKSARDAAGHAKSRGKAIEDAQRAYDALNPHKNKEVK